MVKLIDIFKQSSHFLELQKDNTLVNAHITKAEVWEPFIPDIIKILQECIVKKKTALPSKQKLLTQRLEEALVTFVDLNYKAFNLEVGAFDLPGHVKGVICYNPTNFPRIMKQEMCYNITERGTRLRLLSRTDILQIREEQRIHVLSKETLYYISGWLLHTALKAAKLREKDVKEQLHVLEEKLLSPKKLH